LSTYRNDIALLAESLEIGERVREVCPLCNGGSTREKSLSLIRTQDGYLYLCFRAKCGLRGGKGGSISSTEVKKREGKQWNGELFSIPEKVVAWIGRSWHMRPPSSWYWTPDYSGRIAMSILDPRGVHRGWCLRRPVSKAPNKALTFIDPEQEAVSWYRTSTNSPTYLVEDVPSAVRVSKFANAVALLGTGVGQQRALEISQWATQPVVLALDQDATDLSFRWAKKYSLLWGNVKILPLEKDFKNCTEKELKEVLSERETRISKRDKGQEGL